jgi:N-formylglutamate deformylase
VNLQGFPGAEDAKPSYPPGVVLHIPHDSALIPPEVRKQFLLDDHGLQRELVRMTDHRTLDLFVGAEPDVSVVRAPVSRLVVDVERFVKDEQEPMAAVGMGVIYARDSGGDHMRRPLDTAEREELLVKHYYPHHKRLLDAANASLRAQGWCLILDGHSFPSVPLPFELDQDRVRAEICIGTDVFHTPDWILTVFTAVFRQAGFTVSINRPYAGAIVPQEHYQRERRTLAIMVEVNRGLYMEPDSAVPRRSFDQLARRIRAACCEASCAVMRGLKR